MKNSKVALLPLLLGSSLGWSLACSPGNAAEDDFGVLVMAHGGGTEWNAGVLETVAPLRTQYPIEVAFGMADAFSLQEAADRLQAQGVDHIAVVKLFISGESWHERTQQILGLADGAPARPAEEPHDVHHGHAAYDAAKEPEADHGHRMEFWRLDSEVRFALSSEGLAEAEETGAVLLDRVRTLSRDPANEDVLVLAHGPGDDAENARWVQYMEARTAPLQALGSFHAIKVATLREDWPEKREAAEREVRDFVAAANAAGRTAIVVPFRVHGFGPYAAVLDGLHYVADEQGLVPHPAIGDWIARQAEALR